MLLLSKSLVCTQGMAAHMRRVQHVYRKRQLPPFSFTAGPSLTFQKPPLVPKNSHFFESYGMHGWFDQENKVLGIVTLQGVSFDIQMLQLWDSHPQGRY